MPDLRDELAEVVFGVIESERADYWDSWGVREACTLAADAILPIITRETERARAEGIRDFCDRLEAATGKAEGVALCINTMRAYGGESDE